MANSNSKSFGDNKEEIKDLILNITRGIVNNLEIEFVQEGEQWRIMLQSEDNGILIGHQGENLLAIQHVLRTIYHNKHPENRTHFVLDVGNYRTSREKFISNMVRDIAYKEVVEKGGSIIIKGLNSYERRLIHANLAEYKGVETSSIGEGKNRRLVIRPNIGMNTVRIEDAKVIDIEQYEKEIHQKEKNGKSV